ncbi:hypothetical protein BJ170DRAFT_601449 [Xylariales sp. AK1849]|nr:hypothetical protein BJ170DRAFT_601449 [Xylariales sp. AK1849]
MAVFLPSEILISIVEQCVAIYSKNVLLTLRPVCRLFDDVLKTHALRTLQLDFTRLDKVSRRNRPIDDAALARTGHLCQALYLDMMVVRDEGEVMYLGDIFRKVPSMNAFVTNLLDRFCLTDDSFTEVDFRETLGRMLEHTPNVEAVRLNLPFQLISKHCQAATMLLGNSLEALAQRPEESKTLKTLVLENVTDIGVVKLWRNPQDVKNIIDIFADLKHLLFSVRRHEDSRYHVISFRQRLWEMIGKAGKLESLCLISLNMDERPFEPVKLSTQRDCTLSDWQFRSIPTVRKPPKSVLPNLTFLELRRVEILPCGLLSLFKCFGSSLKELYLNHVYLKTVYNSYASEETMRTLWIGMPNEHPKPHHRWIATALRQMNIQLRVCRVTNLGYDQYLVGAKPAQMPIYDLEDPCGLGRSLDQRFVEAIMGIQQPNAPDGSPVEYWPEDREQSWAYANKVRPEYIKPIEWDVTSYHSTNPENNKTSIWQKAIDGQFPNCNQFTLDQLHRFADTACEGMKELNRTCYDECEEVNRRYSEEILPEELAQNVTGEYFAPGHMTPALYASDAEDDA